MVENTKPQRVLVIALRYLGDVLLTTPLIHSLRNAYPNAKLDVLVYAATAGMLAGNPDINEIIIQSVKPNWSELLAIWRKIFRRYDLAISTQVGDRPILYTLCASSFRAAPVPPKPAKGWCKRFLIQRWVDFDDADTHTVLQHLKLADALNISRSYSLIAPSLEQSLPVHELIGKGDFVVLHIYPQWAYKRWTETGWIEVARYLNKLGLTVVLTGGPSADEINYVSAIANQIEIEVVNLAGKLTLAQLAELLKKAKFYIGPDTGITHLAAATGVPVIALFGSTNPVKWAPWPADYSLPLNPFAKVGSQQVNNVYLLQGEGACVPCHQEGCDRNQQSHSRCLDTMLPLRVKQAIDSILKRTILIKREG